MNPKNTNQRKVHKTHIDTFISMLSREKWVNTEQIANSLKINVEVVNLWVNKFERTENKNLRVIGKHYPIRKNLISFSENKLFVRLLNQKEMDNVRANEVYLSSGR